MLLIIISDRDLLLGMLTMAIVVITAYAVIEYVLFVRLKKRCKKHTEPQR